MSVKPTGAGNAGTQTVQTQQTSAPPQWVQNANQDIYTNAQNVAQNLRPQQVAQVAPMTGGQQSLIDQLMGNAGNNNGQNGTYGSAIQTLQGVQGFNAPTINAGQLSNTNLSPYLNPYTQDVINTTMATGQQALAQAQNQGAASASGAGAFGGSRQGVQAGVTGSQYALGQAQMAAGLNQANFQQAQGAASQDIGTRLSADTTNAGNAINSAGLRVNAANSAVNAAGAQQQNYLQSLMAALTGQGMIQNQQQAVNNQQAGQANANTNVGPQQVSLLAQILSGLNVGGTTSGTQTGANSMPGSSAGQLLGGGLGGLGSIASIGGKNGFDLFSGAGGAAAGGGVSAAAAPAGGYLASLGADGLGALAAV